MPETVESALAEVKSVSKGRRSWVIPVATAVILTLLFCAYYFVYVGSRREYLANRNFRALALLGDQLQTLISNHGSILKFYADLADHKQATHRRESEKLAQYLMERPEDKTSDSTAEGRSVEARKDYMNFLAPGFHVVEASIDEKNPSKLQVHRRNGHFVLELTLRLRTEDAAPATYRGSLELQQLLDPFVSSLPFDDILLVSDEGTIVYQHQKAGPQFTTLASLLQTQTAKLDGKGTAEPPASADKKAADQEVAHRPPVEPNADPAWRKNSMHLIDATLAGTPYRIFLQPVVLDVFGDAGSRAEPAREWVLCGLRKSAGLEWESLSISYGFIIWFAALFFAICMSGPVLKIIFMNNRERFRLRELAFLGLFLVLLSSVFTLASLHALQFPRSDDTETELQRLGAGLGKAIHDELGDMRRQLIQSCATPQLHDDLVSAESHEIIRGTISRPDIGMTPPATKYPYYVNMSWTDDDGHQIVKWSSTAYVTPLIDLSGQPIYTHPKRIYLDDEGPPFYFGSVLPPNKLDYLGAMSVHTCACNPALCASDKGTHHIREDVSGGSAFITGQPWSLIDPILPFGYGFAVVDGKGLVLFHSDKTRNMRENLRLETDLNREIYAAMFGHTEQRSLQVKYMGNDYKAMVVPIPGLTGAPWSLIVYRDLTGVRTVKLQALTMASTLFLCILGIPVLIVAVICVIRRQRVVPEWLWPNRGRVQTYLALISLYSALIAVFLLLGFGTSSEQSVVVSAAILYAALLLTTLCFWKLPSWAQRPRKPNPSPFLTAMLVLAGLIALGGFLAASRASFRGAIAVLACVMVAAAPIMAKPRHYLRERWTRWNPALFALKDADQPEPKWFNSTNGYVGSAILMLLLAGVLVPMSLFRASVLVERRLAAKEAQLHLASALARRRAQIQEKCESQYESNAALCLEFSKDGRDQLRRIVADPSEFANGNPQMVPHASQAPGDRLYSPFFRRVIYLLHHDYNDQAAEMLGVISSQTDANTPANALAWVWEEKPLQTTLRWHGLRPWPNEAKPQGGAIDKDLLITATIPNAPRNEALAGMAVAAGVILVIGGLFQGLARRIFLSHIMPLKLTGALQVSESLRQGKNTLVLLPPVSDWKLEIPSVPLDLVRVAGVPGWAETVDLDALPRNTVIEIRAFEFGENDTEIQNQKLILLDKLVHRENTQLAVAMTVPASSRDYRRIYPAFEVVDLRDEPFHWLKRYEGPARDLLWKECGPLAALWPIGAQIATDIKDEPVDSEETIVSEVLERADGYYRLIWNECSPDQKFVLAQLAADGALNPMNGRAIRQLMRRGLIVKDPQFRIMNASFRRFLLSATTRELKQEWLRESRRSGWGKLHGAFFITIGLTGVFLLTTQNALWQSSAAYVTTALGALGTLLKLFSSMRGAGSAEKAS